MNVLRKSYTQELHQIWKKKSRKRLARVVLLGAICGSARSMDRAVQSVESMDRAG